MQLVLLEVPHLLMAKALVEMVMVAKSAKMAKIFILVASKIFTGKD